MPATSRRLFVLGLVVALSPLTAGPRQARADAKPNFSGHWRMVPKQSDFHDKAPPDDLVHIIEHAEPSLSIHSIHTIAGKAVTSDIHYFTDGRISRQKMGSTETTSSVHWDGPVLVIRTDVTISDGKKFWGEARWTLSDDRGTLTIVTHLAGPLGEFDIKLVCAREQA